MRKRIFQLFLVISSMILIVPGTSTAKTETADEEVCISIENVLSDLSFFYARCLDRGGDCGGYEVLINDLECQRQTCWDAVDGVCSAETGAE